MTDSIHWRIPPSGPNRYGSSWRSGRMRSAPSAATCCSKARPANPLSARMIVPAASACWRAASSNSASATSLHLSQLNTIDPIRNQSSQLTFRARSQDPLSQAEPWSCPVRVDAVRGRPAHPAEEYKLSTCNRCAWPCPGCWPTPPTKRRPASERPLPGCSASSRIRSGSPGSPASWPRPVLHQLIYGHHVHA